MLPALVYVLAGRPQDHRGGEQVVEHDAATQCSRGVFSSRSLSKPGLLAQKQVEAPGFPPGFASCIGL